MSKSIIITPEFSNIISGYSNGESANETNLNRPLIQLGNNTQFLKLKLEEIIFQNENQQNIVIATPSEVDSNNQPTGKVAPANHVHDSRYELKFAKNTAFNKNFGTGMGTVTEGNDPRLSDARNPLPHEHEVTHIKKIGASLGSTIWFDGTNWTVKSSAELGVDWNSLINKPASFPPAGHDHSFEAITDKPEKYTPDDHTHPLRELRKGTANDGDIISLVAGTWTAVAPPSPVDTYTKTEINSLLADASASDSRLVTNGDETLTIHSEDGAAFTISNANVLFNAEGQPASILWHSANLDPSTFAPISTTYTKTEVDTYLADKVDSINVYTKTEVDTLLDDKANSLNVYTKVEVDTSLADKANTADVYTKTESDTALADKANTSDVYTKTESDTALADKANVVDVYTKAELDTALADKADSVNVYTKVEVDTLFDTLGFDISSAAEGDSITLKVENGKIVAVIVPAV